MIREEQREFFWRREQEVKFLKRRPKPAATHRLQLPRTLWYPSTASQRPAPWSRNGADSRQTPDLTTLPRQDESGREQWSTPHGRIGDYGGLTLRHADLAGDRERCSGGRSILVRRPVI